MTTKEFSDSFDTLLNSYANRAEFGNASSKADVVLDEYEKSVLLTQAQDIIVKSYFYNNLNPQGQGFDGSERRQVDFSSLIKVANLTQVSDSADKVFDDRGILYEMPKKTKDDVIVEGSTDVLFILNERLIVTVDGVKSSYVIVPLNYREYDREMSKAYSQPLKKQAWRLFQNSTTGFDVQSELIPIWNLAEDIKGDEPPTVIYRIRYVQRPDPIVLVDLPEGLTIDGFTEETECSLNPVLHVDILNKAVELALTTRGRISSNQKDS